ncbi:hypothetical protein SAMN05660766_2874 [Curtobacterium sp. 314Chir4.1]|uniref:hypothetical protein n=1 Tax=Curtobacterium sp. 314Chir4.1 TaxID=1279028 RepID=UPI000BD8502A|nr:hypothetical protein [Curtobacterium sp. 314Chir4.1]SOC89154.1 hypothetical protein SAMN05660766_2874 [Curtobacterium sp. 314Chir4.1]
MTDQHQADGWGSVPNVDEISGEHGAPRQTVTPVPARPRRKLGRGPLIGIIAGGAAVVLLAVAGVVGYSVGTSTHSADRPVRAFLDDLSAGKVEDALKTAGIDHDKGDVLLTDAAYAKAKGRVTGYRIAATRDDGDTATVTAYLRQGGRDVSSTFTLDKTGTDWGVFPVWELEAPKLGAVDVSVRGPAGAKVLVGGQGVTTSKDGTATLTALPGTYDVAVDGGKWYSADATTATVAGFGGTASSPVSMTTKLTAAGEQSAKDAVNAWVDGCIASTDAAPKGCSFYAYGEDSAYTYTNQKWTLDTRPAVSVGGWLSNGWLVTTTTYGRATFTADISGAGGVGTASAGPMNVNASGYITGFTDAGATFRSAIGNGSSDTGS